MTAKNLPHYYGAVYHITSRGNNRQAIFSCDADRIKYLELLQKGLQRFDHQIHGYCLMGNHVHLLIQVGTTSIDQIIHNAHSCYAKWFNHKKERVGHLFQGRYHAQVVSSQDYLLRLIRYIHLNPVKACMVSDPADYRWSSHRDYLGLQTQEWVCLKWVLDHFDRDPEIAIAAYELFVQAGVSCDLDKDLIAEIDGLLESNTNTLIRNIEVDLSDETARNASVESITSYLCEYYQVKSEQLYMNSSTSAVAECRAAIAWLALNLGIDTVKNVATFFRREVSTVSKRKSSLEKNDKDKLQKLRKEYLKTLTPPSS